MMNKLILATLAFIFSFGSAYADWEYVGNTKDGSSTAFVDFNKIRSNGMIKDAWVMTDFKSPQKTSKGKKYQSIKGKISFDCSQERRKSLASVLYSGRMGNGEVVEMESYEAGSWNHEIPGTLGEAVSQAVCQH